MHSDLADRTLGLLRSRETWTGARLARELGVSLRTVRRVLAALAADGVPLDAEPGRGGGVRLAGPVGLPRLRLDHREALDLMLALAIAESLRSPLLLSGLRGLRQKLGAALPEGPRDMVDALRRRILVGAPASAAVAATLRAPRTAALAVLQDAFLARAPVRLAYEDGRGARTLRDVEPQYLLLNHPAWYLLAHDRAREAGRSLRIDRIAAAERLEGRFAPRPAPSLLADVGRHFAPV